ncbi:TOBE domain-containing protein [Kineococcus sp. SYSU DK002]|uniref:TOBE domain-containing protein n=1 Tax=Kineococcus sp. SYSU DK002 TaxID=3383123 RepID=UPI003D7C5A54
MPQYRVREVADLLGVSDDTARRWTDAGTLPAGKDAAGRTVVDGATLAAFAVRHAAASAAAATDTTAVARSARNRFAGLVTRVVADGVMAQVEMQCGPHRVVSLMSREAVEELGLAPGSRATAVVKATTVIVETPGGTS